MCSWHDDVIDYLEFYCKAFEEKLFFKWLDYQKNHNAQFELFIIWGKDFTIIKEKMNNLSSR
ncbi:MAG TPA: hypothetical protein DCF68_10965 [Cyanothece sp. UBA12306]|nr:hypothetical protein [Cyanothece sp. UBA12306]